jgi:carbon monoxide dehydrogenase subunit G
LKFAFVWISTDLFGGFPKVPSQEFVFAVKLPITVVWSFMNNRAVVGRLFPGCKEVKILNELDSLWTVAFSLGPFSRTLQMKGHTTELIENERIAWTATHDLFVVTGETGLRSISSMETEITYYLEARSNGSLTFLQNIIIGEKMRESARIFVEAIKKRLAEMEKQKNRGYS